MSLRSDYLETAAAEFESWRVAIRHILETLPEPELHADRGGTHSISVLVQHLHRSHQRRWSDPFADPAAGAAAGNPAGAWKGWADSRPAREDLLRLHEEGWNLVQSRLAILADADLEKPVKLRGARRPWLHALLYHWAHYAYHFGHIVAQAKIATQGTWSIADASPARPAQADQASQAIGTLQGAGTASAR